MKQNSKLTKVILIGNVCQGTVSDAINKVIDNEIERGITITQMLESEKSIPYVNIYRDKPKSKYHR